MRVEGQYIFTRRTVVVQSYRTLVSTHEFLQGLSRERSTETALQQFLVTASPSQSHGQPCAESIEDNREKGRGKTWDP